jgi:hypothetical protein
MKTIKYAKDTNFNLCFKGAGLLNSLKLSGN